MSFNLKNTVPWGRTLVEYKSMFSLTESDLAKQIISFGDGPASFNSEMNELGKKVTSLDPIYQFSKVELRQRIHETKDIVMDLMKENKENFIWTTIKDLPELEQLRMGAMSDFLADYEIGLSENRYIMHELPESTNFKAQRIDLGLSSHFLLLYSKLGLGFHIKSISEMLRVCKEIRIFPILNLNAEQSELLPEIEKEFNNDFELSIEPVNYEFQKGGNKMLRIQRK